MAVEGGARTKLTSMTGGSAGEVSPDDSTFGIIYSNSTKPHEVYLMPNRPGAAAKQVTTTPTEEWRSFKWVDPQLITYKTRDGVDVYARLFTPEMMGARRDPAAPAVVFVHGAGYAQNAHKYWPSYYREYMFHNLLASRGYRGARPGLPRQLGLRPRLAHGDLPPHGRQGSGRRGRWGEVSRRQAQGESEAHRRLRRQLRRLHHA